LQAIQRFVDQKHVVSFYNRQLCKMTFGVSLFRQYKDIKRRNEKKY